MDWFLMKKAISSALYPVPAVLLALGSGLFLLWITPWKRAGRLLVTLGTMALAGLSWGPVADSLVRPLEEKHPPFVFSEALKDVRWVVVLGSGHVSDPKLPPIARLDEASLARLAEAISIHHLIPRSRLLLSGGKLHDPVSNARVMAEAALSLGVDPRRMVLEENSRDTEEQAREIKGMLAEEPFVLVTSAIHMPRAMEIFQALGMRPVAAPTGHMAREAKQPSPSRKYPSSENLLKVRHAVHEYLGIASIRVRNWFQQGQVLGFQSRAPGQDSRRSKQRHGLG